ncbi:MAG TPA: hypothetical protein VI297_04395 [Gemmatimonadales bacterium]
MPRPVSPVPSSLPLARLVALSRVAEPLGVWLEAARPPVRLVVPGPGGRRLLLFGSDLGMLLALTPRIAVWSRCSLRVIAARALGRARRLALRLDGSMPGLADSTASLAGLCRALRAERHVAPRQPIDCVAEGPLA